MTTITIELPEPLQKFVESQVLELGIDAPERYLENLVREEQKRKIGEECMKEIQKRLDNGGDALPMDEAFWEELRQRSKQRREAKARAENFA